MGSLTSPANQYIEDLGDGAYGLLSLNKKTRMSNHLQMSAQGSTFSSVLWRPWVFVRFYTVLVVYFDAAYIQMFTLFSLNLNVTLSLICFLFIIFLYIFTFALSRAFDPKEAVKVKNKWYCYTVWLLWKIVFLMKSGMAVDSLIPLAVIEANNLN